MTVHPVLARLFTRWNDERVAWCLLRGPQHLDAPTGDLDLLVAPHDVASARRAAEQLGFVLVPGRQHGTHLLQYDRVSACWLWLHIVTDLSYGPYRALATGAASECLERRRVDAGVATLAPSDEFWALLLHGLLDRRKIAPRHRERLQVLAGSAVRQCALADAFGTVAPPEWTSDRVVQAILATTGVGDGPALVDALEALGPGLVASVRRRARVGLVTRAQRRVRRGIDALREASLRRGVSVALLGPDGAGKSTLAAGLERSSVFPVRHVYMGLTGGLLRYVDKLRVPGVVRVGRLLVIWGRYLRARYHQARGRLVIFDRYIYDADVPPPYHLGPFGRAARWMDGRSCPPPDLVVILDAPGALMYQRKGEYTPEVLEHWRQRFLTIKQRVPGVELVDASQPAATVRAEVLDHIWRRYAARWKPR